MQNYNPYKSKNEYKYIKEVLNKRKFADGYFQKKCNLFLEKIVKSKHISVTQSGSDALEVCSLILKLKKKDEIILPSFTFSTTLNSFLQHGAKPIFCDIHEENLCIDLIKAEKLITKNTKAIYLVHYGNNICDLDRAKYLKKKYNLYLIEDAAHSIFSKFKDKYAGTIGDLGVYSFHETKNITSGQGGAISINNKIFSKRANIILDKGNDRINLVKKNFSYYNRKDLGSEFKMAELPAAFLYSQIKDRELIKKKRRKIYNFYSNIFKKINTKLVKVLQIDKKVDTNYHIFCLIFKKLIIAKKFHNYMRRNQIPVATHYYPLHFTINKKVKLPITENIFNKIIRLPLNGNLKAKELNKIKKLIINFFS